MVVYLSAMKSVQVGPVSYTHLDVYKRQSLLFVVKDWTNISEEDTVIVKNYCEVAFTLL